MIGSDSKRLLFSDKDIKSYEWNEQKVYFNDNIKIPDEILGPFKKPYMGSEIFNTGNHDKFQLYINEELNSYYRKLAQLDRAFASHAKCHRFDPGIFNQA